MEVGAGRESPNMPGLWCLCVRSFTCDFSLGQLGHMVSLVLKSQLEQEGEVTVLLLRNFVRNQL